MQTEIILANQTEIHLEYCIE